MGRFVKQQTSLANGSAKGTTADSIQLPTGTTAQQPTTPTAGQFRYNTENNNLEFYNGSSFVQINGGTSGAHTITRDSFTLDGSTLIYGPLSFAPAADQNVMVFIEGVFQDDSTYSISGTDITLSSTQPSDDNKTLTVLHGFDTA
jgi:hypothetical protein